MDIRLANYTVGGAAPRAGLVAASRVHDLGGIFPDYAGRCLQAVYDDWAAFEPRLADITPESLGPAIEGARRLAPSLLPSAIFFAGFNFRDHVSNMMKVFKQADHPDPKASGIPPWHNLKPRSSLCGSGDTVELPTPRVDWEIELAVVIGRRARRVAVADALGYVAGYTVGIDLSARDRAFRPHTPVDSVARMDWIAQKGFDGACPLGPWLTPARQVADPQDLSMRLRVNDTLKQDGTTREMIFSVAEAVAHLSSLLTLAPGDVILTGTPAGTGAERGEWLTPGDTIRAEIDGIGELLVHTI